MKLIILGVLFYFGYRLVVPKQELPYDSRDNQYLSDDEYSDYEEIE